MPVPSQRAPSGAGEPGRTSPASFGPAVVGHRAIVPTPGRVGAQGRRRGLVGWGRVEHSGCGAPAGAVVGMTGVDVVRGENHLLRGVDWTVEADHRWVILGPNGAGKTTLLQLAAAQMHPTRGEVRLLGETLGAVDVFELRPRIGLTSAALAQRIAPSETTGDIVVSAGYAVVGRWREQYDVHDLTRAGMLMEQWGVAPVRPPAVRHAERGRAQAHPDRPRAHARPGAAAARRARRRPRPRRPGGPRRPAVGPGALPLRAGAGAGHAPRRGDPAGLHARPAAARRARWWPSGAADDVLTEAALSDTFGLSLSLSRTDGRFTARRAA